MRLLHSILVLTIFVSTLTTLASAAVVKPDLDENEELIEEPLQKLSLVSSSDKVYDETLNTPKVENNVDDDGASLDYPELSSSPMPEVPSNPVPPTNYDSTHYDPTPQQSPFVEPDAHPTESHRPDPRFAHPRACAENQYLCRKASPNQEHVRCIPNEWMCNGRRDCEENDDEQNCGSSNNAHRSQQSYLERCQSDQFQCHGTGINGIPATCIDKSKVCDAKPDCPHNDDERGCETVRSRQDISRAPEAPYYPDNRNIQDYDVYHRPQAPQPVPYWPQTECPKPAYSEEQYKKLEWINRCVKSCMAKV